MTMIPKAATEEEEEEERAGPAENRRNIAENPRRFPLSGDNDDDDEHLDVDDENEQRMLGEATSTMSTEPVTSSLLIEDDEYSHTRQQQHQQQQQIVLRDETAAKNANDIMNKSEHDEEVQEKELEESRMFLSLTRSKRCARILRTFPRSFALFLGVVIPLFSLIFISMFFGNWLSRLESPDEISANDAILATQMQARVFSFIMVNSSVLIPSKCTELFLQDDPYHRIGDEIQSALTGISDALEMSMALKDAGQPSEKLNEAFFSNETVSIRNDELFSFMKSCGESARNVSQTFFDSVTDAINRASADLTFNWIRCYEGASDLSYHDTFQQAKSEYLPAAQESFYTETWQSDQQRLFLQYFNERVEWSNMNHTSATIGAFNDSIREATGGSRCNTNGPSGAWFWFTIMTTVGYGNQSPTTFGGALMVFTLGFLSILAFGGVLASAGYIVSRVFDNIADRANLKFLSWPWVACLVWGSAYYAWMGLIAFHTKVWKQRRLNDESFSMNDGYWFSYISTTSIGLGDIYLEPEVIVGQDLIVFPLLFLTGFTLLSAFLGKFSEAIIALLKGNKKGLVESLLDQIDHANSLPPTPSQKQSDSSSESGIGKTKGNHREY